MFFLFLYRHVYLIVFNNHIENAKKLLYFSDLEHGECVRVRVIVYIYMSATVFSDFVVHLVTNTTM